MEAPILDTENRQSYEIQLIEATGEWFVRVIEQGQETTHKKFDSKRAARTFALAERSRLGVLRLTNI